MMFKIRNLSLAFIDRKLVIEKTDTGTVIATVFKAMQSLDQKRVRLSVSDISNNSTHIIRKLVVKITKNQRNFKKFSSSDGN
jgi:hypothetical protein